LQHDSENVQCEIVSVSIRNAILLKVESINQPSHENHHRTEVTLSDIPAAPKPSTFSKFPLLLVIFPLD